MCPKVLANTAKSAWLRDDMVVVHRGVLYIPQWSAQSSMGARGKMTLE
jgi:hypothetical protein